MHTPAVDSADPFCHLPHLRQRLVDPEQSKARVTPDVLARWDQRVFELTGEKHWRLPDDERESNRQTWLADIDSQHGIWVFGYGSLMWDPGFHFVDVRQARLAAHRRCFNYKVIAGRGTPAVPGLVLSLMPDDLQHCDGLVFRIAPDKVASETQVLWAREMLREGYQPRSLLVSTAQGEVQALVFVANPTKDMYEHQLSLLQTAQWIAAASGYLGSNRDYLHQLADQLEALGIEDSYVQALHALVAKD